LPRPLAVAVTCVFVSVTFITVRAADLSTTIRMVAELFGGADLLGLDAFRSAIPASDLRMMALPLLFGCAAAFVGPKAEELALRPRPSVRSDMAIVAMLLLAYMFMSAREVTVFRYRQF